VFLGLGLIVCLIQAFVFSLLTMIYIGLALQEAH
jgi:F0F1-type ATP synthase membrane subunit a